MDDYYDETFRIANIKERFEQRKEFRLPPNEGAHSHGKEHHFSLSWNGDGQKFINYKIDFYNGRLYYLDLGYLFSCNEDGTDRQILLKVGDYFKTEMAVSVTASTVFLAVNRCGIYLYQHNKQLSVVLFSHAGQRKKNFSIKGSASQVYIAEAHIYYSVPKGISKHAICYLDTKTNTTTTVLEVSKVLELYGNMGMIVAKVSYEKVKSGNTIFDEGWYRYTIATGELVCLSSGNCPPHLVFTCPDAYIEGTSKYVEFKDKLTIRAVDLDREIMWIATPFIEKLGNGRTSQEYWEPMVLAPEGAPIVDAPIWRLTHRQFITGTRTKQVNESSYFDGTCFLNGRSLTFMKSFDISGFSENYCQEIDQGACQTFRVLHGHVYADFNGKGWEQYKLEDGKMHFVRSGQFGAPDGGNSEARALVKAFAKR